MASSELRAEVLRAHGAGEHEVAELLAYGGPPFGSPPSGGEWPLPDEPFAAVWDEYAADSARRGAWPALRERLVQLRFPIAAGVGASDAYRAATGRGLLPGDGEGLQPVAPERVRVFVHETPAGRLPVVAAGAREDFEALVRALTRRNEPDPVPASMGACIVGGYNNWDRVARLRRAWEEETGGGGDWGAAFASVMPRKELYQDRFVLLSSGPYSGTPAAEVGRTEEEWARDSFAIRLEHECAHYFTRRVFGSMTNTLRDELIADFMGISAAAGRFRADWLLRFMGLERFPEYREGGRLQNYRGTPPLSDGAFAVLQRLVHAAAHRLEETAAGLPPLNTPARRAAVLVALCGHDLEEMAAGELEVKLAEA
jgi:hypothetical protein